jgi:cell wall-associated NlpC family hydrolase
MNHRRLAIIVSFLLIFTLSLSVVGSAFALTASQQNKVVSTAKKQLGKPYSWGAAGPDAFDCSGLVVYCYRAAGVKVIHNSGQQYSKAKTRFVYKKTSQLRLGDLIFATSNGAAGGIHSVAIYVGGGRVIGAWHTGASISYKTISSYAGKDKLLVGRY